MGHAKNYFSDVWFSTNGISLYTDARAMLMRRKTMEKEIVTLLVIIFPIVLKTITYAGLNATKM